MLDYVSNDVETAALLAAEQDPGENERTSRAELHHSAPTFTGRRCVYCPGTIRPGERAGVSLLGDRPGVAHAECRDARRERLELGEAA